MGWVRIKGEMDVTLRVPFTVLVDEEDALTPKDWADMVNAGILPDALEGVEMPIANAKDHECVDWHIESAERAEKGDTEFHCDICESTDHDALGHPDPSYPLTEKGDGS